MDTLCSGRSTEAQPVHLRQYFRLIEPFINRVNLIRGPVPYIVSEITNTSDSSSHFVSLSTGPPGTRPSFKTFGLAPCQYH